MDSWENIILQWINCLYGSNSNIKSLEELQDGKIYYNLINRVITWNVKITNENHRDIILQFLKDEYPNFPLQNENNLSNKLCIATLVLSRLSLEPIIHTMLCNLDVDVQIKIKSILEIVYSLDKTITEQDLFNIFSTSNKSNCKLHDDESKFIMDDFIESPLATDDNIQMELTKQIRQLKVQIETMEYEKSDLVADIAAQDKHIKELQMKLQEALTELKMLQADNLKCNNNNCKESKCTKDIDFSYPKEENLKKYLYKLKLENNELEDQKKALTTEVKKLYTEKYQVLKERNESKKQAIELGVLSKSQETQIKDLQTKLQQSSHTNTPKFNNSISSIEVKDVNAFQPAYLSKLKSLEKSIMKLKTKNYQLEQEKQAMVIGELKLYKEKHYILKEKNENKKKAFEALMLIKSQEKQIKDIEKKLLTSEKYVIALKTLNHKLVQEKRSLIDELKLYKKKHGNLLKESEQKKKINHTVSNINKTKEK